ncbi:DUF423 domain-containing protein [Hymenobacter busanensis]|uniref:DUF423 domain-containing protein n=1 Tax=Hymenobacter busanensis TaxID=2607656 RepID=A0A7L4ZSP9_9BACT|nr:DUF423 domain-containing protein [Hymenobacter busanensis]KAA9327121.1 DUF423 domain-containing protein [Hymenobacter busanensis]QHJ05786.1 DUF423 domain-containing protein [Hymenobacter busanensis]
MTARLILLIAAVLGALGVSLGAFGAHALHDFLAKAGRLDTFETAVRYQFYHTLALLALGILRLVRPDLPSLGTIGWLWLAGIVLFSGSLYGLCFTSQRWFGPITPLGGLCFIIGWVMLAVAVVRMA